MEKQIKVIYGTTLSYQVSMVSNATKVGDFAKENNLILPGASLQLNGAALGPDKLSKTFADLAGNADDVTLMSVVNSKNA